MRCSVTRAVIVCLALLFPAATVLYAAVPLPPTATSPGSGSAPGSNISTATPTFQWTPVSGATKYGLYVSKAPYGSANLVYTNTNISGTSFTIPTSLTNGTSYRWQVTAFNVSGESNGSNLLYFTVSTSVPVPSPPTANLPGSGSAPGSNVSTATPTFQWSSVSGVTKYGLYISQAPYGAANLVYSNTNISGTSFTIPASLTNATSYRWQVTAFNASGESNGSNLLYFTVSTDVPVPSPPTANSPGSGSAPGTNVSTATPTFQWTSVSGVTKYGLYISQAPYGAVNLVYSNTNISGTSFTIPLSLTNGVSYRWQVTALNASGESNGSNLLYFTVSASVPVPSPPTANSPGSGSAPGSNVLTTTPTFQWSAVSGATKYGLYISQAPYGSANLVYTNTNINGTSFTIPTALTNGTSYRWQVTAFSAGGESNASNLLYFTVGSDPVPSPPVAQSPGSGSAPGTSVSTGSPTFQWSAVGGATKYGLYISVSPYGQANVVYSNLNVSGTSFTLPTTLAEGQYRWQVTAWNASGESGGSNLLYFTVAASMAAPTASSPGNGSAPGSNVGTTTPMFQWTSVNGATRYGLYISQSPYGAANLVYSNTNVSGTSFTIPTALTNGVSYRWQVTAFNAAGIESSASNLLYFTVSTGGTVPSAPTASSPGSASAPGANASTTTPTFQWTPASSATRYGLYISQSPYGPANLVYSNTNISGTSFTIPTALTNGVSYRWQVTAFNAAGTESSASNLLYFTVSTGGTVPSAPTASFPGSGSAPGSNVSTTAPTFQWTSVNSATRYGLYISQSPYGPANLVYSNTNVSGTSFTIPTALTNEVSYRWQVTAFNAAGTESSASNLLYFTVSTGGTVPSAPTANSPGSNSAPGSNVNTTTPTFQWTSVNSTTRYGLYISQTPYGPANLIYSNTNISSTSFIIPTALTNGVSYRWQVTAFNAAGTESAVSNLLYFTVSTGGTVPSTPTASSPGSISAPGPDVSTTTPTFQWSAVNNATRYGLYISQTPYGSANLIYSNTNVGGTSFTIPTALTNGISYRWQVTAFNVAGVEGSASNLLYFTVSTSAAAHPDLVPSGIAFSRTSLTVGESVTVTVTVANRGNALAAATTTRIRMNTSPSSSDPSDAVQRAVATVPIAAGGSAEVGASFTLTEPGTYYAHAYVDHHAVLEQSDRGNDAAHHGPITVKSVTSEKGPDLVARDVKISPTFGPPGAGVRMTFNVANDGNDLASTSTAEIRLAASPVAVADSDPLLDRFNVPSLGAGAAYPVDRSVTIPSATSSGTKYVWVIVDADRGAGQREDARANDRTHVTYVVNIDNPNAPTIDFVADPDTIDLGQTTRLRWTTTNATSVTIDNEVGAQPVNSSVDVKPLRTTTWTLTAIGPGGTMTARATVTIRDTINEVTVGGLRFKADSITRLQNGYRLTGAVTIQNVISYNGTMTLLDADSGGRYTMEGSGVLRLPRVTLPNGNAVVLYDGAFSFKFRGGEIFEFLEKYSRFSVAGWKVEIDTLAFLSDGVRIEGSLRIPQFGSVSPSSLSTTIDVTTSRGVEVSGRLQVSRIGLAGGFWLERVDIGYDRATNTFDGTGTLRTTALGITVALKVVDGCPNSGSLTVSRVPIVLGTTGLQLVNYGVGATGLCGISPFGIGLHTDLTIVKNPNPDLLSFTDVNAMYLPPTQLKGAGALRLLHTDVAHAKIFFNYAGDEIDCDDGLCFQSIVALPSIEQPWIVGELEARVMLSPFRIYGSPRVAVQIPKSCSEMNLRFREGGWACSIISNVCKRYPCVLGEMDASLSVQPSGDPVATIGGQLRFGRLRLPVYVTFSEGGDRRFHLHFGRGGGGDSLRAEATGDFVVVVPRGTADAYIAFQAAKLSEVVVTSPSGRKYVSRGETGVDYFEDAAGGSAVYALQNPESGSWTVSGVTDVVSNLPSSGATIVIRGVSGNGRDVRIEWQAANAVPGSQVSLTYAGSFGGPDLGVIADAAAANSIVGTVWNTAAIPSGMYYARARITDPVGASSTYTFATPVQVVADLAPAAPRNLRATVTDHGVSLAWEAPAGANVEGYIISRRTGASPVATETAVGNVLTYELGNLDRSTGYVFEVIAYDAEGRRGGASNAARAVWSRCELSVFGTVPQSVSLDDSTSFSAAANVRGGCTDPVEYRWDLGDSTALAGPRLTHRYAAPGVYGWTLQAASGSAIAVTTGVLRVQTGRCTIQVEQPAPDATIDAGDDTAISWSISGPCSGNFKVDVIRGGVDVRSVAASVRGTALMWKATGLRSGRYYIRVSDKANPVYAGVSQEFMLTGDVRRRAVRH